MDIAALIARASAESDLDDAVRVIQDALGVTDGGYADLHFQGDGHPEFENADSELRCVMMRGYFQSELSGICDGLENAEILDFFGHVRLAESFIERGGAVYERDLAESYSDIWREVFGMPNGQKSDVLECFLNHVCNAAKIAAGVALLASHDTMISAPAAPATPESDDFKRGYDRGYEDGFSDGGNNA